MQLQRFELKCLGKRIKTLIVFGCILLGQVFYSEIYAQLTPSFSMSKSEGCVPLIVDFTNTSTGGGGDVSIHWDFGNGNQSSEKVNTQAVYTEPGEYTVKLTLKSGNTEVFVTSKIIVYDIPKVDFSSNITSGCIPLEVNFKDLSVSENEIIDWVWNFGDGTGSIQKNPKNTYISDSKNKVTLVVTDNKGCKNTLVKNDFIIATQKPKVNFTYSDTTSCKLPIRVKFQENVSSKYGYTRLWNFGNGTVSNQPAPTAGYSEEKKYTVTLSVLNEYGCTEEMSRQVTVEKKGMGLQIESNSKIGCVPFTYQFKSKTDRPVTSLRWEIDTLISNQSEGAYVFKSPGKFTVKLFAEDETGCTDVVTEEITVRNRPKADFTFNQSVACSPPFQVDFKSTTPSAVGHYWNFGKNTGTSNLPSPTYTFLNQGAYDVLYIVTDVSGCSDTVIKKNAILIEPPYVEIEAVTEEGCVPYSTDLVVQNYSEIKIKSIRWIYPDGSVYYGNNNPPLSINTINSYEIKAEIEFENASCEIQTVTKTLLGGAVKGVQASLQPDKICVKEVVKGSVKNPDSQVEYTWIMGDGTRENGGEIIHEYDDVGIFEVLVETNFMGCRDSIFIKKIEVKYPQAAFRVKKLCENGEYEFTNNSTGSTYNRWNFDDGTIVETDEKKFIYKFQDTGVYKVQLYVENFDTQCKDSITVTVDFNKKLNKIKFSKQQGCVPYTASFQVNSDEYKSFQWKLADSISFEGNTFQPTLSSAGVYDMYLTANRKDGCVEDYYYPKIIELGVLESDFDFNPAGGCAPITVDFVNHSFSEPAPLTAWEWEVQGYGIIYGGNPSLTFNENIDVDVKLTVSNKLGCTDSVTKTIPIYIPVADFSSEFKSICTDTEFKFENLTKAVEPIFQWSFGDANIAESEEKNPVVTFPEEKTYSIKLTVIDANNCTDSIEKGAFVKVENFIYDFDAFPKFKSCPELVSNFTVSPENISYNNLQWNFGDGNQSLDTNKIPVNIYAESGIFDVTLTLEDYRGCRDTIVKEKLIEVKGPRGKVSFEPAAGCLPLEVTFTSEFVDTKFNFWDFGNGVGWLDNSLQSTVSYTYDSPGKIFPSLVLDDGLGCLVTLNYDTIFVSGAKVDIESIQEITCSGGSIELLDESYFTEYDSIVSKLWQTGDMTGVGDSFLREIETDRTQEVFVKLTVETSLGCRNTDSIAVKIYAYPKISLPEELIICKGETIQLKAEGAEYFTWSPERYVSDTGNSEPFVSPLEDTWFKVVGYDTSLCQSFDSLLIRVSESFEALAEPDTLICYGEKVSLRTMVSEIHSGEYNFTWSLNNQVVSKEQNPIFTPLEDATYVVNIKNGGCKEKNLPVYVRVANLPNLKVYRDTAIALGQSVNLLAVSDPGVKYQWVPNQNISCLDCPNPTVSPTVSTAYQVKATNEFGCFSEGEIWINVIDFCSGTKIKIPNIFSPNHDGINDVFRVQYDKDKVRLNLLRVYNRYGELIFESTDADVGWDGLTANSEVNTGVYVYYLDVDCFDGESKIIKGNVTLLR